MTFNSWEGIGLSGTANESSKIWDGKRGSIITWQGNQEIASLNLAEFWDNDLSIFSRDREFTLWCPNVWPSSLSSQFHGWDLYTAIGAYWPLDLIPWLIMPHRQIRIDACSIRENALLITAYSVFLSIIWSIKFMNASNMSSANTALSCFPRYPITVVNTRFIFVELHQINNLKRVFRVNLTSD